MTIPPTTIAVRDATVGPLSGTYAVSCGAISTASTGTSRASATSCGKIVLVPCPISVEAVRIRMRPSPVSSSETTDASLTSPEPVKPAPCHASASPMPLASRWRSVRSGEPGMVPGSLATRALARRAPAQSLELGGLGGAFEDLLAGDALAQHLAGRRRVAEVIDVAPADLQRRDPELLGEPVEMRLRGELDLRRAEPAEGAVGRRVGPRGGRADPDVRAAVGPPAWMAPRLRTTGVSVQYAPPSITTSMSCASSRPSAVIAGPVPDDRRVALGGRRDVLVAVVDHPHRSLRP